MIILGDSLIKLKELDENSVDAIVTDPPYGWRFMGKAWDGEDIVKGMKRKCTEEQIRNNTDEAKRQGNGSLNAGLYDLSLTANQSFQEWTKLWATEALRVLKPGGHALIFCGPRTYHRMASGVEDAGFEIRDQLQWLFGSGFPKSHNLKDDWLGWGTALKPANEPIVLARKPLEKGLTVAENVLKYGTGAINVDASRIGTEIRSYSLNGAIKGGNFGNKANQPADEREQVTSQGRWPANILLDEQASFMLDEQSGHLLGAGNKIGTPKKSKTFFAEDRTQTNMKYDNGGGASRFFYCAKTSKSERNAGLEGMPEVDFSGGGGTNHAKADAYGSRKSGINHHPTVKPIKLMEYLIKLVTPPQGTVLDPFMGSGSTGVACKNLGFDFIGIEMNEEYMEIAKKRIEHAKKQNQRLSGLAG